MYIGFREGKIKTYTAQPLDKEQFCLDSIEYTDDEYVLSDDCTQYILKPDDWDEQQKKKEQDRINTLSLTRADVERALYKSKGIDFDDVIELVKDNPEIDIKALKIELKANNFYRGNIYLNKVAILLGFSEKQIDNFFQYNDYKYLMDDKGE